MELHPDINFYIGAVDNELSEDGMVLPGLGDAGDRLFGKPFRQHIETEKDEAEAATAAAPETTSSNGGKKRKST
jgi:hypothetical protein